MKYRILFVDDEVNILKGLKRMLRGMRGEWEMAFAESGKKALEMMNKVPIDVIVSDMRMPEMDGSQLLNEVRKRHPETARIILSGYSKKESVLRTVGPAHQYLAKPCDGKTLAKTISGALGLRGLLRSEELRGLVSGLDSLPTPPNVFFNLLEELNSSKSSAASIAEILSHDIAMTTQILKLTNSAFFALPMEITSIQKAVQLLGMETIRALTLLAGFFTRFEGNTEAKLVLDRLSKRSISLGTLAMEIAREENFDKVEADRACCAGTLSHVGTLLLITKWPDRFQKAVSLVESEELGIIEAERQIFGASHAELGAFLLGLWGFNDPIVEAVAYHHNPSHSARQERGILMALHVAQYLAKSDGMLEDEEEMLGASLDLQYLEQLDMIDRLPAWRKIHLDIKKRDSGK